MVSPGHYGIEDVTCVKFSANRAFRFPAFLPCFGEDDGKETKELPLITSLCFCSPPCSYQTRIKTKAKTQDTLIKKKFVGA
jgi:hypothetical protein